MGTIFKVGDRVFDIRYGWGTVKHIQEDVSSYFPVNVLFDNDKSQNLKFYSSELDGEKYINLLSFTEYTLQGFSQRRPIDYEKCIGKWGKFWNKDTNDIVIDKLIEYYGDYVYEPFESRFTQYQYFEPLIEEQIRLLNLE
jgi:hypothetical protein